MNNSLPTARRGRALLPAVAAIAASLALAAPAVASDGQSASTLRDASTTNAQSLAQAIAGDATVSNAKVTGVDVQVGRVTGLPSKYFSQDSVALSTGSLIAADPQADSDTDFEYSSVLGPNQALDTTGDLGGDGDAALSTLVGDDTYDASAAPEEDEVGGHHREIEAGGRGQRRAPGPAPWPGEGRQGEGLGELGIHAGLAPRLGERTTPVGNWWAGVTSTASAPTAASALAARTECAVSFVPTPAVTAQRSPTASTTARTVSTFSSSVVVADSPVVPLTTRPSCPLSTRWFARRATPS